MTVRVADYDGRSDSARGPGVRRERAEGVRGVIKGDERCTIHPVVSGGAMVVLDGRAGGGRRESSGERRDSRVATGIEAMDDGQHHTGVLIPAKGVPMRVCEVYGGALNASAMHWFRSC